MKPNNVKALSWIKNLLTGFTGAKVGHTGEYSLDYINGGGYVNNFYKATGIKGYYGSTTRFWDYYCYDKTANVANPDKVETNGEAGSFIYINFNNVFASDLTKTVGVFTVNGKFAFEVLEKSHTEGRVDFYDVRKKMTVNDTIYTSKRDIIIIRNSDKPVFIPITRKEYLQQMLKDVEISRASRKEIHTRSYNDMAKAHEEDIKRYKLDKNFTPEKEAIRRKWFAEDQEKLDKLIKKIDPDSDAALEAIKQYLQKPAEWLNRSVRSFYPYPDSYSAMNVTHYFENLDNFKESKEDYTRRELVSINPDYFNKTLSNDVPQLIMVELVKAAYWYMYILEKKVKQPGGLKALIDIVNPGKSALTETVPPVVTPTYTLSYLPKLTKLTPLKRPAGMKPSTFPVVPNYNGGGAGTKLNFEIPAKSPKLSQMPQLLTEESYKAYILQLNTAISNAIKPDQKRKADEYIKNKKLTQSKNIGNTALAAWLQNAPRASLYLYSKAVITNPSDVLAANNFSAFLLMGGLPEKSIPILEYWNKQKPGEATILANLGNAYVRLGDVDKAMKYLQQCVQRDSLNATANKILCLLYLKKGDTKKAEEHGTKSITSSHDQQVISVLQQLNKKIRPGEIMSREHKKEFPLLKRIRLPVMPSSIDQMDEFKSNLEAEKASLEMTMQSIYAKMGTHSNTVKQKVPVAMLAGGVASIRMKAQSIVLDAMQNYTKERAEEYEVFHYQLETMTNLYETKVSDIMKTYDKQLKNLKSGEGGDEDEILRLEMARCKEIYAVTNDYVAALAPSFNQYAQRQEYIARKYYRDIANWAPYWMPQEPNWFRSIQKDYLEDITRILREYRIIKRSKCAEMEGATPEAKRIKLKEFEDEYCANMKGKLGLVGGGISWTCNSWSVEAGEGLLLELEMNYTDDGSFESFVLGGGLGAGLDLGGGNVIGLEAGASVKEFIKVGFNEATGKVEVKDFGVKAEATVEGSIGPVGNEIKILELTAAVNAGFEAGGVLAPVLHLK
jgi:tetratricopeptide (TPR) repeat protein